MTRPPKDVAPPLMYLVELTTSMSTPSFFEENCVKGITVVSATKKVCFLWASSANAPRSATSICGLVTISKKMQAVFPSTFSSTSVKLVRSQRRASTPKRPKVSVMKEKELPKRCFEVTMFLPWLVRANNVLLMAAMPELTAVTLLAPVSVFTLSSKLSTVGFSTRE